MRNKNILFVCGFDLTGINATKLYKKINNFFDKNKYKGELFSYKNIEEYKDVYNKLDTKLKRNKYDVIISYSLGATLVCDWVLQNKKYSKKYEVIYLMPYILNKITSLYFNLLPVNTFNVMIDPRIIIKKPSSLFVDTININQLRLFKHIQNEEFILAVTKHKKSTIILSEIDINTIITDYNSELLQLKNCITTPEPHWSITTHRDINTDKDTLCILLQKILTKHS